MTEGRDAAGNYIFDLLGHGFKISRLTYPKQQELLVILSPVYAILEQIDLEAANDLDAADKRYDAYVAERLQKKQIREASGKGVADVAEAPVPDVMNFLPHRTSYTLENLLITPECLHAKTVVFSLTRYTGEDDTPLLVEPYLSNFLERFSQGVLQASDELFTGLLRGLLHAFFPTAVKVPASLDPQLGATYVNEQQKEIVTDAI